MPSRSPMRIVAPSALLAVVVVVFLVLQSGASDRSAPDSAAKTTTTRSKSPKRTFYTVQENDNLTSIAQRYGLTVDRLRVLNPDVDPQAIHEGQRLRLRK